MREGTVDWGVPPLARCSWVVYEGRLSRPWMLPWASLVDCNFRHVNQIIPFLPKLPLLDFFFHSNRKQTRTHSKNKILKSWWETKTTTKINNNNSNNKNSQNLGEKAIISAPSCYSQGWVIWCFGNGYLENWLGVLVRRTQGLLLTGIRTSSSPPTFWSLLL